MFRLASGLVCFASALVVAASARGETSLAGGIDVIGWPLPDLSGSRPDLDLGDDPVFGRQVCPPLSRLNLAKKDSEVVLAKKIEVAAAKGPMWHIEPRPGLFWWDGEVVTNEQIAGFVREVLPRVVARRGGGVWELPKHDVAVEADGSISVKFATFPKFGPFVLNGVPLYREVKATSATPVSFECAGLYKPTSVSDKTIALAPTPGYKFKKPLPSLRLYAPTAAPKSSPAERLELRYAEAMPSRPEKRAPDDLPCDKMLDIPAATMIVWNTASKGPAADKNFRRLITQLIPVSDLAAAGSARLADANAGLVPKLHPGNVKPRKDTSRYDLKVVSDGLNKLGFKRKTAASPRLGLDGKPLSMTFSVPKNSSGLVEKVIADAFSAVGIGVTFKPIGGGVETDGVLSSFMLDWPRVSFLGNFHSGAKVQDPFKPLANPDLDKKLEAYAESITSDKPDFGLLGEVQSMLQDLEPTTVLLAHKACVSGTDGLKLGKRLDSRDPDWFRQLLF